MAKPLGLENNGSERPLPDLLARQAVLSLTCKTPENNGKMLPQPDRENTFTRASGGGDGSEIESSPLILGLRHNLELLGVKKQLAFDAIVLFEYPEVP